MLSYRVKIRQDTYLWGGTDMRIEAPSVAYLHIRLDETAEEINLFRRTASGSTPLGILYPGESVTVTLGGATGVRASCRTAEDCFAECAILIER